jgi:hypothetical protein
MALRNPFLTIRQAIQYLSRRQYEEVLALIIDYMLDGIEPDLTSVKPAVKVSFILAKNILDSQELEKDDRLYLVREATRARRGRLYHSGRFMEYEWVPPLRRNRVPGSASQGAPGIGE